MINFCNYFQLYENNKIENTLIQMPYKSQKGVFSFTVEVAKKLRKENPKLAWKDAIKEAWTTAEVKKAREEAINYEIAKKKFAKNIVNLYWLLQKSRKHI